jgi:DNA-binding response OmpR family regulator
MVTERSLRRILLVEDDPDIQDVAMVLLSHVGGFEVRACGTAEEALRVARDFDPDLILLDVMMPGLGGQGAFTAFRQMPATASTPVIFMTARVQPREILEYRQLGSLGVIPKPFDPESLADTIQGMWDRHEKARLNEARREDLAALRNQYAAELPERLRAIEAAMRSLRDKGWDPGVSSSLYDMAHRLAGSAAIYGFPEVSEAAVRVGAFGNGPDASVRGVVDSGPLLRAAAILCSALRQSMSQGGAQLGPEAGPRPAAREPRHPPIS